MVLLIEGLDSKRMACAIAWPAISNIARAANEQNGEQNFVTWAYHSLRRAKTARDEASVLKHDKGRIPDR